MFFDQKLIEALPAAAYVCDADGLILCHNARAADLWGRTPRLNDSNERFCGSFRMYRPDGSLLEHQHCPMAEALRTGRACRDAEVQIEQPDGNRRWLLVNIEPLNDQNGGIAGAINCFLDITERKRQDIALHDSEQRLLAFLEALPTAVYVTDEQGYVTFYNRAAAALSGREPAIGHDRWCITWRLYTPEGDPLPHDQCPMARTLRENRALEAAEIVAERPDGCRRSLLAYPTPLRDSNGRLTGALNMLVDITERKRLEEHRQLLINELNHRVKNTLTMVQSMAQQSFRNAPSSPHLDAFVDRLIALSKAQDVLNCDSWHGVNLQELVSTSVAPICPDMRNRFTLDGPEVSLTPKMALSLSLALHELCTNAAKYGALSTEDGRITVSWNESGGEADRRFRMRWLERHGPRVEPPRHSGFGTRLLERGLAFDLDATVCLEYAPGGVICDIDAPLPQN